MRKETKYNEMSKATRYTARKALNVIEYGSLWPPEINNEPSKTVPDMALTPLEILQRFTQGRTVPQSNKLVYTGDTDFPDLERMDLVEIDEMARQTADRIKRNESDIKEFKKRKLSDAERLKEQSLPFSSAGKSIKNDDKKDPPSE